MEKIVCIFSRSCRELLNKVASKATSRQQLLALICSTANARPLYRALGSTRKLTAYYVQLTSVRGELFYGGTDRKSPPNGVPGYIKFMLGIPKAAKCDN